MERIEALRSKQSHPMISYDQCVKNFIFHCSIEKNLSEKTLQAYKIDLRQFNSFIALKGCGDDISDIKKEVIKEYLLELSVHKPKTIKRKVAVLKALFNFLEFEDLIPVSPFRKIRTKIKEPFTLPAVMNIAEVRRLFQRLYDERKEAKESSYDYFEKTRSIAVFETLFATGFRISELCGLRTHSVDLVSGEIKVNGKGGRERLIYIGNTETLELLKSYNRLATDRRAKFNSDFFFINRLGNGLSDQSVRATLKSLVDRSDLTKHITPHTFRHTFASLLLEEGVDIKYIQSLLGHSSIMTTQIYTHVTKGHQKKILAEKHPRHKISVVN